MRETHYPARIHLPDDVDRLCLDLIEELDRAFAAACTSSDFAWTDVNRIPEEALREIRGFKESAEIARQLREKLRVALRELLRRPL